MSAGSSHPGPVCSYCVKYESTVRVDRGSYGNLHDKLGFFSGSSTKKSSVFPYDRDKPAYPSIGVGLSYPDSDKLFNSEFVVVHPAGGFAVLALAFR